MSKWSGKYVIGLTGNIATGKSVVRRMLEHLGAYGIDADALAHRAIARGAPAYQPTVDAFGKFILDPKGEIDRTKLGRIVFANADALTQLETIVHPFVEQAIDVLIRRATQPVVVIEAIKILEGDLASACDAIWVTTAPIEVQQERLMRKRGMSAADALQRIHAQADPQDKVSAAHVVIANDISFEHTWDQVVAAWKKITSAREPARVPNKTARGELTVERGRPRDSALIADLINRLQPGAHPVHEDDIMAAFGEKAFLLVRDEQRLIGLAGWQVENLVARITEVLLDPSAPQEQAVRALIAEVERASRELQSEAALLFLTRTMAQKETLWNELGYVVRTPQTLGAQAWQDAALESMPAGTVMLFKTLRQDRVLRPI